MSANTLRSSIGGVDANAFFAPPNGGPVADIPDGIGRDDFAAIEPALQELNLSPEQTGKLAGAYADKVLPLMEKRARDSLVRDGAEVRAEMERELHADPVVGGKNLNQARAFAARAIAQFIPDKREREPFERFLNATGFGNQRHLLRILAGAGRVLSNPNRQGGSRSEAEKFYGRK